MNKSLQALCLALKKIAENIHSFDNSFSFVILTGKNSQGKTSLLNQSPFKNAKMDLENGVHFYYNNAGIVLELGETWLNRNNSLLTDTFKELNRCHKAIKISGFIFCVDSSCLLKAEPLELMELCKSHAQLFSRFVGALSYPVEASIILTKLDSLVGFSEFFQSEHVSELNKPIGFSLNPNQERVKLIASYQEQSDRMIETLAQQIIKKLHPARSGVKRTLIREFPLQLASLRTPVQSLLQALPNHFLQVQSIYFTSSEQGGVSIDKLNKKIQHEYALTVQDSFAQSHNYRPYFIRDALLSFQQHTQIYTKKTVNTQKKYMVGLIGLALFSIGYMGYQHIETSSLLDDASREMLTYETLLSQNDKASALYHLSLAEIKMGAIPQNLFSVSLIDQLNTQLKNNTANKLQNLFLPDLLNTLEATIRKPSQSQLEPYLALKVYLMLAEPSHFNETEVVNWFKRHWKEAQNQNSEEKATLLLKRILAKPLQTIPINRQLVSDARNYLNALPLAYLYYSLAKGNLPEGEALPIHVAGFDLPTKEIPFYFTQKGFQQFITILPELSKKLQDENWVLARLDLNNLEEQLTEAYCFEYLTWWQNFIQKTKPQHYQSYEQARSYTNMLHQTHAFSHLIHLIQEQTKPGSAKNYSLFNQKIASQFTNVNLISTSARHDLSNSIHELSKFISTISLINDHGQTIFELTRSRFQGSAQSDPLSVLYNRVRELPEPISTWAKQVADDTWCMFISESRDYLNNIWQELVFTPYISYIAKRYPIDVTQKEDMSLRDFDTFFAPSGTLNTFVSQHVKPFLDTSNPQWQPKELNGFMLPISNGLINELIRANVIANMFFPNNGANSKIEFSLQKINLDPVVSSFELTVGKTALIDNQDTDSLTYFNWPEEHAKLFLKSIDGNHFELEEKGVWAFFRLLQRVNVLVDNDDSASLQILFEINGNSGRYQLKTESQINPFSPGILTGFNLNKEIA